jgi:disulfide bond formation protein DsbB
MFKFIKLAIKSSQENWPWYAGFVSISMLGMAHFFETFMKLYPCPLCLHQREVYWVAFGVSAVAIVVRKFYFNPAFSRAFDALLAVIFLAGAVIAGFHAGVELHFWKGLPECSGAGSEKLSEDLLSALSKPMNVPKCEDVAWSLFGISMAGWNMILSIMLAIWSCICALKGDTGANSFGDPKEEM